MTAIACTIATWRDEHLLAEAVASAAPHVDVTIVVDGAYAGLDPVHGPAYSDPGDLMRALDTFGRSVFMCAPLPFGTTWPGEIEKRNVLLELARAFLPAGDPDRWVLVLDADEVLVHGERLHDVAAERSLRLKRHGVDRYVVGLVRVEPDGSAWDAASRLFPLTPTTRYAGRSYFLINPAVDLTHRELGRALDLVDVPHVSHRWDRRSPARLRAQWAWGRQLAERDGHG